MAAATPSLRALRQLFRLVDRNHDRTLSSDEFRVALGELGVSADAASIAALMRLIDKDHSGLISEQEFVTFFEGRSLADVQADFAALKSEGARVTVCVYAPPPAGGGGGGGHVQVTLVAAPELRAWLREGLAAHLAAPGAHVWVDVAGSDDGVGEALEEAFALPRNAVSDLWIPQATHHVILGGGRAAAPPASPASTLPGGPPQSEEPPQPPLAMLFNALSLRNQPLRHQ